MKTKYLFALLFLTFSSCKDSEPFVVEPVGSAAYYINNLSNLDLDIIFIKSASLNLEVDDSKSIEKNSTVKIFSDGIIGVNPLPTHSFSEIRFYNSLLPNSNPVLNITKIIDENWNVILQDLGESGYGLTKYELTITDDSFN